jgi:hypothetical protein
MGQKRYLATAGVGVVIAVVGGIIGILSLLNAIGATHGAGSTTHYTVLAVLSLAIAVAGAALAVYGEHQLHHLPGGSSAWAVNEGWRTAGYGRPGVGVGFAGAGRFTGARRGTHAPGTLALWALALVGVTLIMVFVTLHVHSEAQRSAYTQAHGVSETATADDVQTFTTHNKGNTTYTYQIDVTIAHPTVGDGSATVYGQGITSVQQGDTLTVLVDPRQPSYAEIPGAPYTTTSKWVGSMVVTIVFGIVAVFMSRTAVLMLLRHRRVSRGQPYTAGV